MKKILAAGALALTAMAGSAQAAPTITFAGGSGTLPVGSTIIQNFESFASGAAIGTFAVATNGTNTVAARPTYGSTGNFAAVFNGGSYVAAPFTATNLFSFALGSLDYFNMLTLSFADGTTTTYTGGQIIGTSIAMTDSGSRTDAMTNGVVSFATGTGPLINGATFASNGGSAFEFDNLAIGGVVPSVPEPAAWGMMILGFALVGGALRRRTATAAKVKFAY